MAWRKRSKENRSGTIAAAAKQTAVAGLGELAKAMTSGDFAAGGALVPERMCAVPERGTKIPPAADPERGTLGVTDPDPDSELLDPQAEEDLKKKPMAKGFDPNEARDAQGRWATDHGFGPQKVKEGLDAAGRAFDKAQLESNRNKDAMASAHDAFHTVMNGDKNYKALHDKMDALANSSNPADHETAVALMDKLGNGHPVSEGKFHVNYVEDFRPYPNGDEPLKVKRQLYSSTWKKPMAKGFDPNEPRAADGEWTSGSAGEPPALHSKEAVSAYKWSSAQAEAAKAAANEDDYLEDRWFRRHGQESWLKQAKAHGGLKDDPYAATRVGGVAKADGALTAERLTKAWTYLEENAGEFTPGQVEKMQEKISAAWKAEVGSDFSDSMEKANPYHDEHGRFTTANNAHFKADKNGPDVLQSSDGREIRGHLRRGANDPKFAPQQKTTIAKPGAFAAVTAKSPKEPTAKAPARGAAPGQVAEDPTDVQEARTLKAHAYAVTKGDIGSSEYNQAFRNATAQYEALDNARAAGPVGSDAYNQTYFSTLQQLNPNLQPSWFDRNKNYLAAGVAGAAVAGIGALALNSGAVRSAANAIGSAADSALWYAKVGAGIYGAGRLISGLANIGNEAVGVAGQVQDYKARNAQIKATLASAEASKVKAQSERESSAFSRETDRLLATSKMKLAESSVAVDTAKAKAALIQAEAYAAGRKPYSIAELVNLPHTANRTVKAGISGGGFVSVSDRAPRKAGPVFRRNRSAASSVEDSVANNFPDGLAGVTKAIGGQLVEGLRKRRVR